MPNDMVERHLPEAIIIWGQTNLPRERLFKAKKLKATINVETNLIDNIDYYYCFANSIHVPTSGSAFVDAVADTGLILKGLPPVVCRKAMLETVKRFRSKPVSIT